MSFATPALVSRLPRVGTTIFTTMSQLALEHQAINLSQGFPDFDGPQELLDRVGFYIHEGANQYAPMSGVPLLRRAIADKLRRCYGREADLEREITVTSGATEALFAAIAAVVSPGDEVIVFDPAYDSYEPAIELNGGRAIHLPLLPPEFRINWEAVAAAITPRTRMIILNSPHNPTGQVLHADDITALQALVEGTELLILADEVYEHIVFDQQQHLSLNRFPDLAARSFIVSSFGKTYHVTGWKVGYCVAPASLTAEFRKVHQYLTFSTSTPMQLALGDFLLANPEHDQQLPDFYAEKRDLFNGLLQHSSFIFSPSAGTYFQLMDYAAISDLPDTEFVQWLIREAGVAAIPLSVFYQQPPEHLRWVRFCFAKGANTLQQAAERLRAL
ncbi:pyridoxal phosphate-dependent aminotransferase [Marinospirillum alkaliphilum]|uniref:Methionine aminotransferase n=1 Tax=Marinospirillum alkaliphilum DSM 21637 TaxID=1122209 RepID=A0A1K1V205_9GAMM|nr:pyridoxal phosphate-dependent aminotransferase [Marinospirillum alkaliphilum]SFX19138.1 methionine aminotransferase [Marinospirillum alkaliphilum DSM 21637]